MFYGQRYGEESFAYTEESNVFLLTRRQLVCSTNHGFYAWRKEKDETPLPSQHWEKETSMITYVFNM
jgi:hypothetical protein